MSKLKTKKADVKTQTQKNLSQGESRDHTTLPR